MKSVELTMFEGFISESEWKGGLKRFNVNFDLKKKTKLWTRWCWPS